MANSGTAKTRMKINGACPISSVDTGITLRPALPVTIATAKSRKPSRLNNTTGIDPGCQRPRSN